MMYFRCGKSSFSFLLSGRIRIAALTIQLPKGSSTMVVTMLNIVWVRAICAEGLAGAKDCKKPVNGVV